jgi:acyl carrier protein
MLVHDRDKVCRVLGLEDRSASVDPVSIALEGRIEQWEQRKRDGGRITAAEVGGVLRSDQVGRLSDALADRLHALLAGSGNGNGSHQARSEPEVTSLSGDIMGTIKRCLADLLELDEVEDTKSFHDYGMDSISGVRFSMSLEKKLKLEVPPQLLMDYPNPRALAAHLAGIRETAGEIKDGGTA